MQASHSFRKNYERGVDSFYASHGNEYRNPHAPILKRVFRTMMNKWSEQVCFHRTLDLACGSGEASEFLKSYFESQGTPVILGNINTNEEQLDPDTIYLEATDPYTYDAYEHRLHVPASRYSFEDIEGGILADRHFDVVISSYAMHLIDSSRLYATCQQLAFSAKYLIIISPTKKPDIKPSMGWILTNHFLEEKIHVRLYSSVY